MARFRKPFLILLSILSVITLFVVIANWLIGPRVKGIVTEQINKNLSVPIQVEDIQFSLLSHFPYASVDFVTIRTNGSNYSVIREPLVDAKHVYLMFNLFNVFGDSLKLKKIIIHDANINCYVDADGKTNYDIFKKDSTKKESFNLEVEEVELDNVKFFFQSKIAKRDYRIDAKHLKLNGKFNEQIYDLNAEGSLFVQTFKIDNVNYIDHKETNINVSLRVDQRNAAYIISKGNLQIADLKLEATGDFKTKDPGTEINLNVKSENAGLRELLSLIPGVYTERLKNYRYDGDIYFNMQINGISDKEHTPLVIADFGTKNASLMPRSSDYKLKNIRFKGNYKSRVSASQPISRLQLNGLEASLEGQAIKANLLIEDFSNPYIDLNVHSKINLEVLSRFYMPDTLESISGEVQLDAVIKGHSKDKTSWQSNGSLTSQNVAFKIKGKDVHFTGFNAKLELQGNQLAVKDFKGNAAGSDFYIVGNFDNVLGYFLTKDEKISGKASLTSRNIDLNELLEDKKHTTVSDTSYRLDFSPRLNLDLKLNIAMITFRKFDAWQINGNVSLQNKVLSTQNLNLKTCEGNLGLNGKIDASRNDSILIAIDASVNKININQLFSQLGNFGQNVIEDKNVNGIITANIQFASMWSKNLHCNMDRIYVKSDLTIENGELNNFEPMLALSKFLKGADLRKITFSTLRNQIEIKNQTIYIPSMHIQSNVLDLTASGTHTFNNMVDYKLQLLLSQLMGKKVKEQHTEFGTIEDDGLGRMKLFLSMKGPMQNPKIVYDRKGVEEKINHEVKQEKQNLKGILKNEFGWFKKDTLKTDKPANKPKKQELQLDTND